MNKMPLKKIGAIILKDKKILVVRKLMKNRDEFITPGGKQENEETDEQTLRRELREELGVEIDTMSFFGSFVDNALFENVPLNMRVYFVKINGEPKPQSEIIDIAWLDRDYKSQGYQLGSILEKKIIGGLIEHNLM